MDAILLSSLLLFGSVSTDEADMFREAVEEKYPCITQTEEFATLLRKKTRRERQRCFIQTRLFGYWSCWSGRTAKEVHRLGEQTGFF